MNKTVQGNIAAAIDVGSNSIRLLVQKDGRVLYRDRRTVRLLAQIKAGIIPLSAIDNIVEIVGGFCKKATALGAQKVYAFGTSAVRDAKNSVLLVQALLTRHHIKLDVLSGKQEALASFLGASLPGERCALVDIGGGSTEIIVGQDRHIESATSFQLGAVRLFQQVGGDCDRPQVLLEAALSALNSLPELAPASPSTLRWLGVGGSIITLAALDAGVSYEHLDRLHHYTITPGAASDWLARLCSMDIATRQSLTGMDPTRADILPCGIAILCAVFETYSPNQIMASTGDNLEGYLAMKRSVVQS